MAEEISRKSVIYEIGYDFSKGNKEAQTADQNLKKIDKDADKLTNTFKQANGAFKTAFETDKAVKFGQEILQVAARATTLQGRLRAMRNELAGLDEGSARFQKLAIEAAKLEDKIGDVNQRVRNLASDTKNLDAFVSIATGIAGGFAVAQGAVALFGDENEQLQKTLLKVQASIAILNGLQQVSATIQNESAAKTFIVTNAQKAYAFAVGASTAATRAFNTVLLLGVGGLALGALALVVTYWEDIAKFIGIAGDNQKELNKAQQEYNKRLGEAQKFVNDGERLRRAAAEGGVNEIKRRIDLMEAEGAESSKIFDLQQVLRRKELEELKIHRDEVEKIKGISIAEEARQITALSELIKDKENEITIATVNRLNEVSKGLEIQKDVTRLTLESSDADQIKIKSLFDLADAQLKCNQVLAQEPSVPLTLRFQQEADAIAIVQKAWTDLGVTVDAITSFNDIAYSNDAQRLKESLDNKEISQAQYDAKIKDLQKAKIRDDAAFAITQIAIQGGLATAAAITKALNDPTNLNVISAIGQALAVIATIAATIAQAKASVQSANFAEGTEYLQRGKSKAGKDTIPIMANEGEAIIPTDKNLQEPGLAKAWIDGDLDRYIYRNYVMPEMLKATGKGRTEKDYSERFYKQYLATQDQTVTLNKTLRSIDSKLNGGADYRSRYGRA